MTDQVGEFIFLLFCLFLVVIGAVLGYLGGSDNTNEKFQLNAIKSNVGEYYLDDQFHRQFRFKEACK